MCAHQQGKRVPTDHALRCCCCYYRRFCLLSPGLLAQVLLFLLVYSGRLLDSFFCLLSLALYYLCTRERDHCNFTCCQGKRNRGRAPLGLGSATDARVQLSHVAFAFACWHSLFPVSAVILLFVMSCTQLFFSSFRLLMLLVGTADEMAPPESKAKFAVFAIGAVAAPVIHVREYKQRRQRQPQANGVQGAQAKLA